MSEAVTSRARKGSRSRERPTDGAPTVPAQTAARPKLSRVTVVKRDLQTNVITPGRPNAHPDMPAVNATRLQDDIPEAQQLQELLATEGDFDVPGDSSAAEETTVSMPPMAPAEPMDTACASRKRAHTTASDSEQSDATDETQRPSTSATAGQPAKKLAAAADDGFQTPSKRHTAPAARLTTGEHQTALKNSFGALNNVPQADDTGAEQQPVASNGAQGRRQAPPPPLIIQFSQTYKEFQALLHSIVEGRYSVRMAGRDLYKVCLRTTADFNLVLDKLKERGHSYYTYSGEKEKLLKIVYRGLPFAMSAADLKEDLTAMEYDVRTVVRLKSPRTHQETSLLLVVAVDTPQNRSLFQLTTIAHVKVTAEKLKAKSGPPQCFRCQAIGHVARHCSMPPRCVKCAQSHLSSECTKKKGVDEPTCFYCGQAHVGSYRGCENFKRTEVKPKTAKASTTDNKQKRASAGKRRPGVTYANTVTTEDSVAQDAEPTRRETAAAAAPRHHTESAPTTSRQTPRAAREEWPALPHRRAPPPPRRPLQKRSKSAPRSQSEPRPRPSEAKPHRGPSQPQQREARRPTPRPRQQRNAPREDLTPAPVLQQDVLQAINATLASLMQLLQELPRQIAALKSAVFAAPTAQQTTQHGR